MSENLYITSDFVSYSFEVATGPIDYGFTNDYMFRMILQQSDNVLKGLICSLLHLESDDIISIEVTNPILPGESFDAKEFILDIEVVLNNDMLINLEMQVVNEQNWSERSLSYLCRHFDQLSHGQDYAECKPAVHIGFLDFTPFPESAEFYATYKLLNIKNGHLYSDKFTLGVVDLTHIELATDEDKAYGIDHWASLFKSTTWEELKMIAENNPILKEASENLYVLNSDELARARAQARKEHILHENALNRKISKLSEDIETLTSENQELAFENQALTSENQVLASENMTLTSKIQQLQSQLAKYGISDTDD